MGAFLGGLLAHHEKKRTEELDQMKHDMNLALTKLHEYAQDPGSMDPKQVQLWTDIAIQPMAPATKKLFKEHMEQVQVAHQLKQQQQAMKAAEPQPLGMPSMPTDAAPQPGPVNVRSLMSDPAEDPGTPAPLPSPTAPAPPAGNPIAQASQLSTTGFNLPPTPASFSPSPFWVDPQEAQARARDAMQNRVDTFKKVTGVTDPYAIGSAVSGQNLRPPPNEVMNMGPGSVAFDPITKKPIYTNPGTPAQPKQITNEYEGLQQQFLRPDGTVDWAQVNKKHLENQLAQRANNTPSNEYEGVVKEFTNSAGVTDWAKANAEFDKRQRARKPDMQGNRDTKRSDDSYRLQVQEIDKIGKPITDLVARMGRLSETIDQQTPAADTLIVPELLTVMAGGMGSGLRINEAEIARTLGGRSHFDSLRAALQKWDPRSGKALSVTPDQRREMRALVDAVGKKVFTKQQALDAAYSGLLDSDDPKQHRQIVNGLRSKITEADQAKVNTDMPNMPGPTVGTVENGYRFKGGNPASRESWERVQ